ncbi:MAG TPA: hypothetical protein VIX19_03695 [Terriglobales bacterium]
MKKIALLVLTLGFTIAISAQNTQSVADPWVGTWKLDASQSHFHNPAPQQETVQIESLNQGPIRYTVSGTDAEGKPLLESFDGKADGQTYPVAVNGFEGARMSLSRVSDREYTGQGTMADGTPITEKISLSPDGKTITIQRDSTGNKGSFSETVVFVRQQ